MNHNYKFSVGEIELTDYVNKNGVYQDGVLPFCRAKDGDLYSILGHTNLGGVSLWKGATTDSMEKVCDVTFEFSLGVAREAFNGSTYPDGPLSRGGLWVLGLWIDETTDIFYAYIHNETGWEAKHTNYTVFGYKQGEPDYRHIGRMSSADHGKTWIFEDWIITSHEPCWSEKFAPENFKGGQTGDKIMLGAGDFSLFVNPNDAYMYLFYTQTTIDTTCFNYKDEIFVARAIKTSNGAQGSWKKYYNGSFCEPGNMGKETALLKMACIPCVTYNDFLKQYIMTSYHRPSWVTGKGACQISTSDNLVNWSQPVLIAPKNKALSKPYFTICNNNESGVHDITGQKILMLFETNGEDVQKTVIKIEDVIC